MLRQVGSGIHPALPILTSATLATSAATAVRRVIETVELVRDLGNCCADDGLDVFGVRSILCDDSMSG